MAAAEGSAKRREKDCESLRLDKKRRKDDDLDVDLDLSSDIKGIISALHMIRDKAQKDGLKKNEETIRSVASEIKTMIDDAKSKFEKERQIFVKAISKSSKEFESSLKNEYTKFQVAYEKFSNDKATNLQTLKETFTKYELDKEKLTVRYEQMKKKEKAALAELEKAFADKIASAEDNLKKKKQDDKSFSFLRKSLGSFLEDVSDDD